jgi:small subunit ribosomal protein S15
MATTKSVKVVKKSPVKKVVKTVKTEKTAKSTKPAKAVKPVKSSKKPGSVESVIQIPSPEKQEIITQFQVKEGDTGSPEVQVALLTKRIERLVLHLKTNNTDNHSRRGLLGIVSKRRRLLNYLEKKDNARFKTIVSKLKLGK